MNTSPKQNQKLAAKGLRSTLLVATALLLSASAPLLADNGAKVVDPDKRYHGKTYAEWSARATAFELEHPLAGHPALDTPDFDVRSGQHGKVWFLGAPLDTHERSITVPAGKALFVILLNVECSSLEAADSGFHGGTAAEQRACAKFWADHIVNVFCTIDGEEVEDIGDFRVASPQFEFDAPTPWIFGATGGHGTSVADGYYVMLRPLGQGAHTIHFGGKFHFAAGELGPDPVDLPLDMTYHVTVAPNHHDGDGDGDHDRDGRD
jgi:hypothetical protein